MGTQLDASFHSKIRRYVDTFYSSLLEGGAAVNTFLTSLSTFHDDVRTHRSQLQRETLIAVKNFASLIDNVILDFSKLEKHSEICRQHLVSDVSMILDKPMSRLSISDDNPSKISEKEMYPRHIKLSFEWLLSNLHNPYPSKEFRRTISKKTGCSVKDIDTWFIDIRKRIGWNRLRKTRFSNKQDKIIAAATCFFKPTIQTFTDNLDASFTSEIGVRNKCTQDFIVMKQTAQGLYRAKFPYLSLPDPLGQYREETPLPLPSDYQDIDLKPSKPTQSSSYPTPEPSPAHLSAAVNFSEPLPLPIEPSGLNQTQPPSRKRRQSSSSICESDLDHVSSRRQKRARCIDLEPQHTGSAAPRPTSSETVGITKDPRPERSNAKAATEKSNLKRKRRLSDSDGHGPSKRPHGVLCHPRLQTVSDPVASRKTFTESASNLLEDQETLLDAVIPPPVNQEAYPLFDEHLDVYLHQYNYSPDFSDISLSEESILNNARESSSLSPISSPYGGSSEFLNDSPSSLSNVIQDLVCEVPSLLNFDLGIQLHQPHFQPDAIVQTAEDLSLFNDDKFLSSSPGWLPDPPPYIDPCIVTDISNLSEQGPMKSSVLGDFNYTLRTSPVVEEYDAKRERARYLRDELKRLEAEL